MRFKFLIAVVYNAIFGAIYAQKSLVNLDSIYQLALEASYANNHELSAKHLTTLINENAAIEGLYFDRAVQRELAADTAGAIADLSVLINADKKNADAYFLRGKLYVETFEYKLAFEDLKYAVKLEKSNADAHYFLALASQQLFKPRMAHKHFKKSKKLKTV